MLTLNCLFIIIVNPMVTTAWFSFSFFCICTRYSRQPLKEHTSIYKEGMDQWLLAVTSDPAARGSAKDLEVAGASLVHCLTFMSPWYIDHLNWQWDLLVK